MTTAFSNEGEYRISGAYGEVFYVDPSGKNAPRQIGEATECSFGLEIGVVDVPLSGNRTGEKDGPESLTGQLTIQQTDGFLDNLIYDLRSGNLAERRRRRDAGERVARTFMLQVHSDDPEALGKISWQLEGVRLSALKGGFSLGESVTSREYAFRYRELKRLNSFEIIAGQFDPNTGLPAIKYIAADNG